MTTPKSNYGKVGSVHEDSFNKTEDNRTKVLRALHGGANPRGFTGPAAEAYDALVDELGPEGIAKAVAKLADGRSKK